MPLYVCLSFSLVLYFFLFFFVASEITSLSSFFLTLTAKLPCEILELARRMVWRDKDTDHILSLYTVCGMDCHGSIDPCRFSPAGLVGYWPWPLRIISPLPWPVLELSWYRASKLSPAFCQLLSASQETSRCTCDRRVPKARHRGQAPLRE